MRAIETVEGRLGCPHLVVWDFVGEFSRQEAGEPCLWRECVAYETGPSAGFVARRSVMTVSIYYNTKSARRWRPDRCRKIYI